jgi:hypothetical protein
MIVASKSETKDGTVIKGYAGTSYSLRSVKVSEDGPSLASIGKGDIIRYILDGSNELVDYQVWFDASEPEQLDSINDIDEAYATDEDDIAKRILEIHSTSTTPRKDYPNATFRLQYGTVTDIILKDGEEDDSVDERFTTDFTLVAELYKSFIPTSKEAAIQEEWLRYKQNIDKVMNEMTALKTQFPYTAAETLSNPDKLAEYKAGLDHRLFEATKERAKLTSEIERMKEGVAQHG